MLRPASNRLLCRRWLRRVGILGFLSALTLAVVLAAGLAPASAADAPASAAAGRPVVWRDDQVPADQVLCLAISPDGKLALSGHRREEDPLRLWDTKTGRIVRRFRGVRGGFFSAAFSPDGAYALSGNEDGKLTLWQVATGQALWTRRAHRSPVQVAFAGWWPRLVGGDSRRLERPGHVNAVAFAPAGDLALSAGRDGVIRLWEVPSGRRLHSLTGHEGWISSAAFSPDGTRIVSASTDRTVRLWDAASGKELERWTTWLSFPTSFGFTPDGRSVLIGHSIPLLQLGDLSRSAGALELRRIGSPIPRLFGIQPWGVGEVAVAPDGRHALVLADRLQVWDLRTRRQISAIGSGSDADLPSAMAIAPSGRWFLVGTLGGGESQEEAVIERRPLTGGGL